MANFKSGLLTGAIIGGLYGLLKAPRAGKETRESLKKYLDQTTDDVNDVKFKMDGLTNALKRLSNEGIQSVQEATEEIKISIQHFAEENEPRVRRVNEKITQLTNDIEDAKSINNHEEL